MNSVFTNELNAVQCSLLRLCDRDPAC